MQYEKNRLVKEIKLTFGPNSKPLSEQIIEQGVKAHYINDDVKKQMDECQSALNLLRMNILIEEDEFKAICNKLGEKIVKYFEGLTNERDKNAQN